jgi:hypothetical protein
MAADSYHATIYSASDREDTTSTYVGGAGRNRSDSGEGQQHLQKPVGDIDQLGLVYGAWRRHLQRRYMDYTQL